MKTLPVFIGWLKPQVYVFGKGGRSIQHGSLTILALVLGPMMEHSFRASLTLFDGNLSQFFFRPISAVIMTVAILLLVLPLIPGVKKRPALGDGED